MGFYAVDGGVVVAVACAVLGVVGEGSGGLAGCNKGEEKQEKERDGYQKLCKPYCRFVVECGLKPSVPSRPRTPSPPFRRGGGVWLRTQ